MLGTERLVEFDNCVSSKVKVERTLISYTSIFRFDSIAFCEQQTRLFFYIKEWTYFSAFWKNIRTMETTFPNMHRGILMFS